MTPRLFLIVFDPQTSNANQLHSVVIALPSMQAWWHYLASAYIIASVMNARQLQDEIHSRWDGLFLVAEINTRNSGGWLPAEAWEWINERRSGFLP